MGSRSVGEDELLGLIERIYDAPGGPDGWRTALEALSNTFDGLWSQVLVTDFWGRDAPLSDVYPWDPNALKAYVEHYFKLDPRRPALNHRRLKVWARQDVIADEAFRRSEIYNDFLTVIGAEQCLVANVAGFEDGPNFLSVMRDEARGHFTAQERDRLRLLAGHVDQAVVLHRTLARARSESFAQAALLDALPLGILLVGADGRVRQMNRMATHIAGEADGFAVGRRGRPHAALPAETQRLERLVHDAAQISQGRGLRPGEPLAISRPSGKPSYVLRVVPLGARELALGHGRIVVAILISDPERQPEGMTQALRRLYGLTPAEARLAAALVASERLNDIADRFGVTRETARSQLKAVFAKTGTHGQADLVRLILRSPLDTRQP